MVGEIEWLAGRELVSRGTEPQAATLRGPVDVCGEEGAGRPLTAVKAGANGSPSLSLSMKGAVLVAGMCSTADIVPSFWAAMQWQRRLKRTGSLLQNYARV